MGFEPRQISILMLEAPGDHALCLLCNEADLPPVHTAVEALARAPNRPWVVDAWLNICCALPEYPAKAQAKFAKWTAGGKRVAWAGKNGKEPGWYPPQGDYSRVFGKARIEYIPGAVAAA